MHDVGRLQERRALADQDPIGQR
ncbi:MAG: hypothetical protein RL676_1038, partial [Pseudomonadota bacterium]